MSAHAAAAPPPPLTVYTLLFRVRGKAGRDYSASYEVVAGDAEEAARFALKDCAARGEQMLDIERVETWPAAHSRVPKGVQMRVACSLMARAAA